VTWTKAFDRGAWTATIARERLDRATRLVAGQLADRADHRSRVRIDVATLADSCCLSVTAVAGGLADLASRQLVARDGRVLVLTAPEEGPR
jgi:hypothetical protein